MSLASNAELMKTLKTKPRRDPAKIEKFLSGIAAFDSEMRISRVRAMKH
jgi:hypothetical protein